MPSRLKFIVLLLSCILSKGLCLSDEMQELVNMLHETCVAETGVSEALIENVNKGDFAEDDHLKCYMKCLMDQMAVVSEEGIIDVEAAIAVIPEEFRAKAEPVFRKCGTKIGANPCDNVFLTNKCYFQEAPNDYILF